MKDQEDYLIDLSNMVVPETDEELAKAAVIEVAKIALAPVGARTKLAALNTLLTFTKQKPVAKLDVKSESHDEWLKSAIAANEKCFKTLKHD